MSENLISIQQYAIKHKLSTFAVVKLVTSGKLKTIKKIVNEEEREFVLDDSTCTLPKDTQETSSTQTSNTTTINYEVEYNILLGKYSALQEKYTALLEKITHV